MPLRIGGLSSGLDTAGIIQKLMMVEQQPLINMSKKQKKVSLKKNLLNEINSSLSSLQTKLTNLTKNTAWNKTKSSSSNKDIVSATTSDSSLPGVYNFSNITLAKASTYTSLELVAGASTKPTIQSNAVVGGPVNTSGTFAEMGTLVGQAITDGKITINGVSFEIDSDVTTIDQFMNKVNSSTAGVSMSYDSVQDKFTITSRSEGSEAKITLTDNTGFLASANITTLEASGTGSANLSGALTAAGTGITGLASDASIYRFKINDQTFTFSETDSLNEIMQTVNNSSAGVSMIYDSSTDKFIVSSKTTGAQSVTFQDLNGNLMSTIGLQGAAATVTGQDAQFELNGVLMSRSTNEFDINGVHFALNSNSGPATITVEKDTESIYNSIKEFVNQYNSTIDLLNARLTEERVPNATTELGMSKGLLRGDSTVVDIRSSLRNIVISPVSGLSTNIDLLSEIGISTDSADHGKSGRLVIDEAKLRDAIKNDAGSVQNFFFQDSDSDETIDSTTDKGLAVELYNKIQTYISTTSTTINGRTYKSGVLPMRMDSMAQEVKNYDDRIEDYQTRLEMIEARYWKQFNALEKSLSALNNQGSWLSGQIASLPTFNG